jgi:hypothetical protein
MRASACKAVVLDKPTVTKPPPHSPNLSTHDESKEGNSATPEPWMKATFNPNFNPPPHSAADDQAGSSKSQAKAPIPTIGPSLFIFPSIVSP